MLNKDLMIQVLFWVAVVIILATCGLLVFGFKP